MGAQQAIIDVLSKQPWLLGADSALLGSLLAAAGLALAKAAQYRLTTVGNCSYKAGVCPPVTPWVHLARSPIYCLGVALFVLHIFLNLLALRYVPESTVAPLGAVVVLLNFPLAYGVLNERFSRSEQAATVGAILSMVVAASVMPRSLPDYRWQYSVGNGTVVDLFSSNEKNVALMAYVIVWLMLLATCLVTNMNAMLSELLRPLALPTLSGLFTALWHITGRFAVALFYRPDGRFPWLQQPSAWLIVVASTASILLSSWTTFEGLRHLDCRFFVPASFAAGTVLTVVQGVVVFGEWTLMSWVDLAIFTCACLASVVCVCFISPRHRALEPLGVLSAPLLSSEGDDLFRHRVVLEVMAEHRVKRPEPRTSRPLETASLTTPRAAGPRGVLLAALRWVPLIATSGLLAALGGLWSCNLKFATFAVLTVWGMYNGWKHGLHIALFSYVGQKKMAHFEAADFEALHRAELAVASAAATDAVGALAPEDPSAPLSWEDVYHVVVLPNYREKVEVLRLTLDSIAASKIATRQIGVVLAMEEREAESRSKASELAREFEGRFRHIFTTHHPQIPGEPAGKASNARWSVSQLFDSELPRLGLDLDRVVVTVGDADSEFHSEYFAALTYYFLHGGCDEGETPQRYLSLWQPPMMHYKNYLTQPAIVRLASLFTSQHELANLADPNATIIPYSTYSMSAVLAKAIDHFDVDWISDDWHIGLKIFLATGGRSRIVPIFLAVVNYAPEGESWWETMVARWVQAKRHALGFTEIVYFQVHFPRVFAELPWRSRARFAWLGFFLYWKMMLIHLMMATMVIVGPTNGLLVAYMFRNRLLEDLNSWTFLTNCAFQTMGIVAFFFFLLTNVLLYERLRWRIEGSDDPKLSARWRSPALHFLDTTMTSTLLLPFFFTCGFVSEWLAAVKCTQSHMFDFDVALKPTPVASHATRGLTARGTAAAVAPALPGSSGAAAAA